MDEDELIKLAVNAGFEYSEFHQRLLVRHSNGSWVGVGMQLHRFARLVKESVINENSGAE